VLDLFVFDDVRVQPLKAPLLDGRLNWLTTPPMRDELERVLGYSHIEARLVLIGRCAVDILATFDRHACMVDVPNRAPVSCADPDDQMFIDLAVQHQCVLLSKDAAVLALKKRLAVLQVDASAVLPSGLS
jgi:predicted nucleic acid-binding protein